MDQTLDCACILGREWLQKNVGNTEVLTLACHLTVHSVRENTREWHKSQRDGYQAQLAQLYLCLPEDIKGIAEGKELEKRSSGMGQSRTPVSHVTVPGPPKGRRPGCAFWTTKGNY